VRTEPFFAVSLGERLPKSGTYYAIQVSSLGNGTTPPTFLEYSSVNGGSLKSFAYAYEFSGSLAIAGWTTM